MAASASNVRALADRTADECKVTGDKDCVAVLRRLIGQIEKGAVHAKRLSARQTGTSRNGFAMFELELETNSHEETSTWL